MPPLSPEAAREPSSRGPPSPGFWSVTSRRAVIPRCRTAWTSPHRSKGAALFLRTSRLWQSFTEPGGEGSHVGRREVGPVTVDEYVADYCRTRLFETQHGR